MIQTQIAARGVRDPRVLDALRSVPRALFVPPNQQASAYDDTPLPLERGQTISQPFIVGWMTELLRLRGDERVLELGTGSGYQTAVLARLAAHVYSAELEPDLARQVADRLRQLHITNVTLGVGDGVTLFRDQAPFDAILAAAAPAAVPEALIAQLAEGGRCIIPIGDLHSQYLWLIRRENGRVVRTKMDPVRFVPLRGTSGLRTED
ncbi:MAG: protein-L-isoaspartate O-methyltransferase [Acidobacteria bacterium]|nr:protein-L-isoaspartate O-methyltransferase [Acidobacteriota bacterium]